MRLLLSFILIFSFFIAPHDSDAAGIYGKKTDVISSDAFSETGTVAYSEYGHQLLTIVHKTNVRNGTNQYRFFAGIHPDYSSLHIVPLAVLLSANRLEESYSFCVPIGQKLLYPKHYYW